MRNVVGSEVEGSIKASLQEAGGEGHSEVKGCRRATSMLSSSEDIRSRTRNMESLDTVNLQSICQASCSNFDVLASH